MYLFCFCRFYFFEKPLSGFIPQPVIGNNGFQPRRDGKNIFGFIIRAIVCNAFGYFTSVSIPTTSAVLNVAIVVDAINDDARKFYLKYELQILTEGQTTRLFLPMQHIIETLK